MSLKSCIFSFPNSHVKKIKRIYFKQISCIQVQWCLQHAGKEIMNKSEIMILMFVFVCITVHVVIIRELNPVVWTKHQRISLQLLDLLCCIFTDGIDSHLQRVIPQFPQLLRNVCTSSARTPWFCDWNTFFWGQFQNLWSCWPFVQGNILCFSP